MKEIREPRSSTFHEKRPKAPLIKLESLDVEEKKSNLGPSQMTSGLYPKINGDDGTIQSVEDIDEKSLSNTVKLEDIKVKPKTPTMVNVGLLKSQREILKVNLQLDNLKVPNQERERDEREKDELESLSDLLDSFKMRKQSSEFEGFNKRKSVDGYKIELGGKAAGDATQIYGYG